MMAFTGAEGENKFTFDSVSRSDFSMHGKKPEPPPKPYIPKTAVHVGRLPFNGQSVYNESFIPKEYDPSQQTISTRMLQDSKIGPGSDAKFAGESVTRGDYIAKESKPVKPFVPSMTVHVGRLPFEGKTETREKFIPKEFTFSKQTISTRALQTSVLGKSRRKAKFDPTTVTKSDFITKEFTPVKSFTPSATVHVGRLKFEGGSVYKDTYLKKEFDRSVATRTKDQDFGGMHVDAKKK